MPESGPDHAPSPAPVALIGSAIQELMVTRLGRGFLPLVAGFALGGFELLRASSRGGSAFLVLGAVAAGLAMLAYGVQVVQIAFGRELGAWTTLAKAGAVVPPAYGLYVLGWRGLRGFTSGGGSVDFVFATLSVALGVWVLRSWMRVVEVERLTRVMSLNSDGRGGPA